MRTISAASLAEITTKFGTEPVNIIDIAWVVGEQVYSYADKEIAGAQGKILEISNFDNTINITNSSDSQQVTIKLDDTDGSIKNLIDTQDIHKREAWLYQWFDGLAFSDRFLIFKAQISTPIVWNENDRTVTFDIIARIEDAEVGFSMDEGGFVHVPDNMVGKAWPLCFGTTVNVPALRSRAIPQGKLATGTGIRDWTLRSRRELASQITVPFSYGNLKCVIGGAFIQSCNYELILDLAEAEKICLLEETLKIQEAEQAALEISPIRIDNGIFFQQGVPITIDIDGGRFTGTFNGNEFTITGRLHPNLDDNGNRILSDLENTLDVICTDPTISRAFKYKRERDPSPFGDGAFECLRVVSEVGELDDSVSKKRNACGWLRYNNFKAAGFFWARPGSEVVLHSRKSVVYIANILPSTILRVAAVKNLNDGSAQLLTVPSIYYTVRQVDYGAYTVTEIVFDTPLTEIDKQWEEDIYITQTSSVGPNTVDILEWLIDKYTDFTTDTASFADVKAKLTVYPMDFPILDRPNILQLLQDIAFQARCALYLRNDVFFIKYLSEEPTIDENIQDADIEHGSLELTHTNTDELVTKLIAEWKYDHFLDDPNKVILRHASNVFKYGLKDRVFDFFAFNRLELVRKSATFWLIRKANVWRKAKFLTPLHKLKLETFDTVGLNVEHIGDGTIKGIVESATYNTENNAIDFRIWTPILSGTRVAYDFAYPATISVELVFPTLEEKLADSYGNAPGFSVLAPITHEFAPPFEFINVSAGSCNPTSDFATEDCKDDEGEEKPTDEDDEEPELETPEGGGTETETLPELQDIQIGAPVNEGEVRDKAEDARKDGPDDDGSDKTEDDLPEECGGDCTSVVKVHHFTAKGVAEPGSPGTTQVAGKTGRIAFGPQTNIECKTFDSQIAARAFFDSGVAEARAKVDGWQHVVGQDVVLPSGYNITPDLGIDPETGLPCNEPDEGGQVGNVNDIS